MKLRLLGSSFAKNDTKTDIETEDKIEGQEENIVYTRVKKIETIKSETGFRT